MKDHHHDCGADSDNSDALPLCMNRRQVLVASATGTAMAVVAGGSAAAAVSGSESDYPRVKVGSISGLIEGDPVAFSYPLKAQPNMIVKLGTEAQGGVGPDKDIVAFSVLCTHMGGPLRGRYQHASKAMGPCPFHFSTFDLTKGGTPVHASATQNLPQVRLEVEGDDIYAVGMNGLIFGYRDNLVDGVSVGVPT